MKIKNLLLGMSYDMPKILSITFHSYSIQIEDFKMLTLLILLTLLAPRGGEGENFKPIARNVS